MEFIIILVILANLILGAVMDIPIVSIIFMTLGIIFGGIIGMSVAINNRKLPYSTVFICSAAGSAIVVGVLKLLERL